MYCARYPSNFSTKVQIGPDPRLARATISTITDMRNQSSFDGLMAEAQLMAEQLASGPFAPLHLQSQLRRGLGCNWCHRVNVFYPAIDAVRPDLEERFGSDHPHTDAAG